ncbi:MAG: alpha-glucosidase/alpha-galactosidase [Clostridia bacterium]|nr:alpha-glucosidase/alpha-galactosidase [Clostridia bacterium]
MKFENGVMKDIRIAYIGGGSRGWAWGLMSDLYNAGDISGEVMLYDIDGKAAKNNEIIGNMYTALEGAKSAWKYTAVSTPEEALTGADFVIISILPGTFDEMESDVHEPEKYGIYQSVGDTSGPGGIIRAMRTVPMYEEIAGYIKKFAPDAWVINYTNPMTLCVRTLYRVFPQIKAFGCCHEVFGTQKFLAWIAKEHFGLEEDIPRGDIKISVLGVNHFTWITKASWRGIDLFPLYRDYCEKNPEGRADKVPIDNNWMNNFFSSNEKLKIELFRRYGVIAAAGDRHLAEFCEGKWYLENPDRVSEMHFALTPVSWRKEDLAKRLEKGEGYVSGNLPLKIRFTGEEGVNQIRSIVGLNDFVTNVNLPNVGQIEDLPRGAVVETNARFCSGSVLPVMAGSVPKQIYPLIARVCGQQEALNEAIAARDLEAVFNVFANDPLVTCSISDARKLFDKMCLNTKKYLSSFGY